MSRMSDMHCDREASRGTNGELLRLIAESWQSGIRSRLKRWRYSRFWKRWLGDRTGGCAGLIGDPVWDAMSRAGLIPPEVRWMRVTIAMDDIVRVEYECNCPREVAELAIVAAKDGKQEPVFDDANSSKDA